MSQKPVIFLAFANDRVDDTAYLRNLPKEQDGIRTALQVAVKAGLCEVVERANATIQQLLDVFQDEYYQGRIAIFHYGGHANGYQLLLEGLDGSHSSAHSEGLVSFLARQQGLQLVFLNGCSSQQQATELSNAGISAVVGTSQSINDDVATALAIRFYKGIGMGARLEKAWLEAIDEIKIHKGSANMRDLFWEGTEDESAAIDRFPWEIIFRDGAERIKQWNLPETVDNPLFGLPELPREDLPEAPYRFLERYKPEHAEIFFGRSYYIRDLLLRATDQNSAPIVLLYGQSGVGKSSLLDAGLLPRLNQLAHVVYIRRDVNKGLLGTLEEALGMQDATAIQKPSSQVPQEIAERIEAQISQLEQVISIVADDAKVGIQKQISQLKKQLGNYEASYKQQVAPHLLQWQRKELEVNKPLIILLDQAEEYFTRPNEQLKNELDQFLETISSIFGNSQQRPQGKLILSYRKEYHPEFEEAFKKHLIPRESVFLKQLDRKDIAEVVKGLTLTERIRRKYRISVEDDLPLMIADDLLEDKDSAIAPILQILLTKLWKLAATEELRYFSIQKYQDLKRQGILMDDFFHEQMDKVKQQFAPLEASGLALDILYFHTTDLGTSDARSLEELRARYGERQEQIDKLVATFKDLYLLADAGISTNSLAHDTLATIVQKEFRHSDKLGQRASVILANKAIAYGQNEAAFIDVDDLKLVEEGANGMRVWTQQETALIEKSRERRTGLMREKKRNRRLGIAAVIIIMLTSVGAIWAAVTATRKTEEAELANTNLQEKIEEVNQQKERIEAQKSNLETQGTALEIAKDSAEQNAIAAKQALKKVLSEKIRGDIQTAYNLAGSYMESNQFDKAAEQLRKVEKLAPKHKDLKPVYTAFLIKTANHYKNDNNKYLSLLYRLSQVAPENQEVFDMLQSNYSYLWKKTNAGLDVVFTSDGQQLLCNEVEKLTMRNLSGEIVRVYEDDYLSKIDIGKLSPDGKKVIAVVSGSTYGARGSYIVIWDRYTGKLIKRISEFRSSDINKYHYDAQENQFSIGMEDGRILVFDWNGNLKLKAEFPFYSGNIIFSPDGKFLYAHTSASPYSKNRIACWDISSQEQLWKVNGHTTSYTRALTTSPNGKYLATGSPDKTARIWDASTGKELQRFTYTAEVEYADFTPNGKGLITGGGNYLVLWGINGQKKWGLELGGIIKDAIFSPDGKKVLVKYDSPDRSSHGGSFRINILAQVDISSGKLLHEFRVDGDEVFRFEYSKDGSKILATGNFETVKAWTSQGQLIADLKKIALEDNSRGQLNRYSHFSPNGEYITTISQAGTLRLWPTEINSIFEGFSIDQKLDEATQKSLGLDIL